MPKELSKLVETNVSDNERWLDIAVAAYCMMGYSHPKITELDTWTGNGIANADLVAQALAHIEPINRDELFVSAVIRHADINKESSGAALSRNEQYDLITNRLLSEKLNADQPSPMTVMLAGYVIKDKTHPLTDIAVRASIRLLKSTKKAELQDLQAACRLVTLYGNDNDFAILVKEIPRIVKSNDSKPRRFWPEPTFTNAKPRGYRTIPIIRALIGMRGNYRASYRYCDYAVFNLQWITGMDFGFDFKQSIDDRNKAVARAKTWLAKNPD